MISEHAGEIWYVCSIPVALMLFGLAFFFFVFGILPWWFKIHKKLDEILGCWSLTFPNVGWILSLRKIGDTLDSQFFWTWNIVMTVLMCLTWTVLIVLTITAFCQGKIFISAREDTIKDSVLHMKLRRHVEDLERGGGGRSRFTSATVTPQAQSPRSGSPSRMNSASQIMSGSTAFGAAAMGLAAPATARKFSISGSPPLDSGMTTPSSGPSVKFC